VSEVRNVGFLFWRKPPASGSDPNLLVQRARNGDAQARETLIRNYMPYITRVASAASGRYLTRENDDQISIAMIAFNEAIDHFDETKGITFLSFAETVIKRRIIDYFRKESRNSKTIPFSFYREENGPDQGPSLDRIGARRAEERLALENETAELKDETFRFNTDLKAFGITFSDLVAVSPRHEDARLRAMAAARRIVENPLHREFLLQRKSLPLKALEKEVNVSRKTLERQRKYIIAVALLLLSDYMCLKEYIRKAVQVGEVRP
jgi:RNA polymerase sigma factor